MLLQPPRRRRGGPGPPEGEEEARQKSREAEGPPGTGTVNRQIMPQQGVANRGVGQVQPPLDRDAPQKRKRPEGPNRGVQNAQEEPQPQGILQRLPVPVSDQEPGDGQEGVNQEHDVEIIEMLLMPEEEEVFRRRLQVPGGEAVQQPQVNQLIAGRPEKQRRQKPGHAAGVEPFYGQLPLRRQEQGPAGHKEQGYRRTGQGIPEQAGQPGGGNRAGEAARAGVDQQDAKNSGTFYQVNRPVSRGGGVNFGNHESASLGSAGTSVSTGPSLVCTLMYRPFSLE